MLKLKSNSNKKIKQQLEMLSAVMFSVREMDALSKSIGGDRGKEGQATLIRQRYGFFEIQSCSSV